MNYKKACSNKNCIDYQIMKNAEDGFHKNAQNNDGYHSRCKLCRNKYVKEYRKTYSTKTIDKRNKAGKDLLDMVKLNEHKR